MANHILIPEHKKLSSEEAEKILNKYNVSKKQLPRIKINDVAIENLQCEVGDLVEIIRKSEIYGDLKFYRVVIR
jgi:DNA-directed RNA polymerase subunit H